MPEYTDTQIVLSADSEETPRETHGRYFCTAAELADAVAAAWIPGLRGHVP